MKYAVRDLVHYQQLNVPLLSCKHGYAHEMKCEGLVVCINHNNLRTFRCTRCKKQTYVCPICYDHHHYQQSVLRQHMMIKHGLKSKNKCEELLTEATYEEQAIQLAPADINIQNTDLLLQKILSQL
jgi:hypothetical protein